MRYSVVTLADLGASPRDFIGRKVVFEAYFARVTDLYPTFPTPFSRTDYVNFSVWPRGARLWRADEMRASYPYLYIARDSGGLIDANAEKPLVKLDALKKYDTIKVYGTVVLDNDGSSWVVVDTFRNIEGVRYSDEVIHRLKLADENFLAREFPFAVKDYGKALELGGVPAEVEGSVRKGLGLSCLALEKWGEAAKQLKLAQEKGAGDSECLLGLAEAQIELGLPAEAEKNVRLALAQTPRSAVGRADLAIALGLQGRTVEGLAECGEALKLAPANADVLRARGLVENLAGKTDRAIASYQAAADSRPTDPRIHLELGRLYAGKGDLEKAAQEFDNVVKTASTTYPLPYTRGCCLLAGTLEKLKKPQDAVEKYLDAQKRDETYVPAYLGLGSLYAAAGPEHFDRALEQFRVVAEQLSPAGDDGFVALNRMAAIYHVKSEKEPAFIAAEAECYRKASAIKPADYDNWMNLALTRWRQAVPDRKNALAALAECAKLKPEDARCRYLSGCLLLETNDLNGALVELDTAKRLAPKDPATLLKLAQVLRMLGQDARAIAELREAAAQETADENLRLSIRNSLAYTLADAGSARDAEEALKLAGELVAARGESASFKDTLGWAQARTGKLAEARKTLEPLVANKPGECSGKPEACYHLGYVLAGLKEYPAAIAALEQSLVCLTNPQRKNATATPRQQRLQAAVDALLRQCRSEHARLEAERRRRLGAVGNPDTQSAVPVAPKTGNAGAEQKVPAGKSN
jgi:tetratricopeptide (TPR) repeat protein